MSLLSANVSGFASDPVDVRGISLEPTLGLPRSAVYYSRWPRWFELLFGVVWAVLVVAALTGAIDVGSQSDRGIFGLVVFGLLSPYMIVDGILALRMRPGLVVAANGFDYRTSFRSPGTVFWQEVEGMWVARKRVGRRTFPALYVQVKGGAYPATLTSRPGRRPLKVEIPMDHGNDRFITPAMFGSHQQWLQSRTRQG